VSNSSSFASPTSSLSLAELVLVIGSWWLVPDNS